MKQTEVKDALTTADKQLVVLENKEDELNLNSDDQEAAGSIEGKNEVVYQLVRKSGKHSMRNGICWMGCCPRNSGFQDGMINGEVSGLSLVERINMSLSNA